VLKTVQADVSSISEILNYNSAALGEVRTLLDGTKVAEAAIAAARRLAAGLVKFRDRDVFGRHQQSAGEFGLLPLGKTYVEPVGRRAGKQGPIKQEIKKAVADPAVGLVSILAHFGYGKSLTVKSLAADLAEEWLSSPDTKPYPIFIHTPDQLRGETTSVSAMVESHLQEIGEMSREAAAWLWTNLSIVLVLDSFDEVVQSSEDARRWIERMRRTASAPSHKQRVVLASRPSAVESQWLHASDSKVEIVAFGREQVEAWLARTRGAVHDGDVTVEQLYDRLDADLLGTPILLMMATWIWAHGDAQRLGKTELYGRFVAKIAKGKWEDVQEAHPVVQEGAAKLERAFGVGAYEKALSLVAWTHLAGETDSARGEDYGLPAHRVETLLRQEFSRGEGATSLTESDMRDVSKSIVLSLFFRKAEGEENIRFSHRSFREYLCARYLVEALIEGNTARSSKGRMALADSLLGENEIRFAADLIAKTGRREQILALLTYAWVGKWS